MFKDFLREREMWIFICNSTVRGKHKNVQVYHTSRIMILVNLRGLSVLLEGFGSVQPDASNDGP